MQTLVLASNNAGKLREMREILAPFGLDVRSQREAGFTEEVAETGTTFAENAALKAQAVHDALHCAVLADDSGLVIDALDGAPGVYSHRFAGENATDADRCQLVLEKMQGVPTEKRTARFLCSICYITEAGKQKTFTGACEGIIGTAPQGENGFGYDPVFVVGEKTMAQMTEAEKNAISHRGKALAAFQAYLRTGKEEKNYVDK
jgi:XTP/dITP diphosphohydrolase